VPVPVPWSLHIPAASGGRIRRHSPRNPCGSAYRLSRRPATEDSRNSLRNRSHTSSASGWSYHCAAFLPFLWQYCILPESDRSVPAYQQAPSPFQQSHLPSCRYWSWCWWSPHSGHQSFPAPDPAHPVRSWSGCWCYSADSDGCWYCSAVHPWKVPPALSPQGIPRRSRWQPPLPLPEEEHSQAFSSRYSLFCRRLFFS